MSTESKLSIVEEIKYLQSYVEVLSQNILNSLDLPEDEIEEMILLEAYLHKRIANLRNSLRK